MPIQKFERTGLKFWITLHEQDSDFGIFAPQECCARSPCSKVTSSLSMLQIVVQLLLNWCILCENIYQWLGSNMTYDCFRKCRLCNAEDRQNVITWIFPLHAIFILHVFYAVISFQMLVTMCPSDEKLRQLLCSQDLQSNALRWLRHPRNLKTLTKWEALLC